MSLIKVIVGEDKGKSDIHLCPGQNLYTGIKPFIEHFGGCDSLEEDLINLSSGIYATDLAIRREEREDYIRNIDLTIDVINLHAFERIKDLLESALFTLSRDNWKINFSQRKGQSVSNFDWKTNPGAVLLFSGGIDSMCAAAKFTEEKQKLVLVSHNTHANLIVDECQRNVHKSLEKYYKITIPHYHIKVYGRKQGKYEFPEERENTQRTRSFLFLSLATLVTRRVGFNKVLFIAENGQFAIHLPLNQARVGPFSTHTADPQFVEYAQNIFKTLLSNSNFEITNPFLYLTKGEVVALLPKGLQKEVQNSASCWMISRTPGNKHCGYCAPCISRRISLEYNKIYFKEYANDVFSMDLNKLLDTDDKKRNLIDYLEFISRFKKVTASNKMDIMMEFPELFSNAFDNDKALKLFERVSSQSFEVFKNYPEVLKLI